MNLGAAIKDITLKPSLSACIMKKKGEDGGGVGVGCGVLCTYAVGTRSSKAFFYHNRPRSTYQYSYMAPQADHSMCSWFIKLI